jgi:hypothetical protein
LIDNKAADLNNTYSTFGDRKREGYPFRMCKPLAATASLQLAGKKNPVFLFSLPPFSAAQTIDRTLKIKMSNFLWAVLLSDDPPYWAALF